MPMPGDANLSSVARGLGDLILTGSRVCLEMVDTPEHDEKNHWSLGHPTFQTNLYISWLTCSDEQTVGMFLVDLLSGARS